MTTSTLNQTQTKKEKVNLNQIVGGTFEAVVDSVLGTPPSYETREQITTPVPEYVQKVFSSGRIENFHTSRSESYAKSPELLEKEATESQRRIIYSSLDEANRRAQKVAHEPALADADIQAEIVVMPEEVWNKKLHLSLDFDKKHTQDKPYYMTEYRRLRKEDREGVERVQGQQTQAEIQAPTPFMGENEFHKGIERSGGSHWSNNPG